ncbi:MULTISPECIES: hypothetical protein [unclassified Microcoleus]|uniref:hypothetical protein n=1 Tax=unclassified Microcoleus TaxID=2642155 RepID=UPI002FCFAE07
MDNCRLFHHRTQVQATFRRSACGVSALDAGGEVPHADRLFYTTRSAIATL